MFYWSTCVSVLRSEVAKHRILSSFYLNSIFLHFLRVGRIFIALSQTDPEPYSPILATWSKWGPGCSAKHILHTSSYHAETSSHWFSLHRCFPFAINKLQSLWEITGMLFPAGSLGLRKNKNCFFKAESNPITRSDTAAGEINWRAI